MRDAIFVGEGVFTTAKRAETKATDNNEFQRLAQWDT